MRLRGRTDGNQQKIVKELRQYGCSVQPLSNVGDGCPDVLVGFRGVNYLFEVKDPTQKPSARRLTPDEKKWHSSWSGQSFVIETSADAIEYIGSIR